MVLADDAGTPLGIHVEKASPSEVTLAEATLDNVSVKNGKHKYEKPKRLVADRAYVSNTLRALLVKRGIEPIIPVRGTKTKPIYSTLNECITTIFVTEKAPDQLR